MRPSASAVLEGIRSVVHPGRNQIEVLGGRTWLFDAAHNPAGVHALAGTIDQLDLPRPVVVLLAVLADKDWRSMLPPLIARADSVVLTEPPSAAPERRWDARHAAEQVDGACPIHVEEDFARAVEAAAAAAGNGTVVVTGSFHTVGSALSALGLEPFAGLPGAS
jgi:dihydrofolate synthase/folylpolyglutamate synthase